MRGDPESRRDTCHSHDGAMTLGAKALKETRLNEADKRE
jgi:hypothetical protein